MKRYLLLLVCLLFTTSVVLKAEDTINIGYCAGEISKNGAVEVEGARWVNAAAYLTPDMLSAYDGKELSAVRAGLTSKLNVDSVKVWVRHELTGENMSQGLITLKTNPKISKGWNEVSLDDPVIIDASKGIYIGFSYHQKTTASILSAVGSPQKNSFYLMRDEEKGWEDYSDMGALSVEATVTGATVPEHDMALIDATFNRTESSDGYDVSLTVVNVGSLPVSGFSVSSTFDGSNENFDDHFNVDLKCGEKAEVKYFLPQVVNIKNPLLTITLLDLDNMDDEFDFNNSITARYVYKKRVLIEEFTTEMCGNCPRVAGYLHEVLEMDKYANKVVAACHHSAFYTDWLTQECDEEMCDFYKLGYAPAMMFDRYPMFESGSDLTPLICPNKSDIIQSIDKMLDIEPTSTVSLIASYEHSNQTLTVNVYGERLGEYGLMPDRLTIYILEDNIPAIVQAGATGEYFQQHVIRWYNSTWGDFVEWTDDSFVKSYKVTIPEDWIIDNIQIVAAIGNWVEDNINQCVIDNCASIPFPSVTAIEVVENNISILDESFFMLNGSSVAASDLMPGIYLKKTTYQSGQSKIEKVIIRHK